MMQENDYTLTRKELLSILRIFNYVEMTERKNSFPLLSLEDKNIQDKILRIISNMNEDGIFKARDATGKGNGLVGRFKFIITTSKRFAQILKNVFKILQNIVVKFSGANCVESSIKKDISLQM